MQSRISVGGALLVGVSFVNGPVMLLLFGTPAVFFGLGELGISPHESAWLFVATLLGGVVAAWTWWPFSAPRWRVWDRERVTAIDDLNKQAVAVGLTSPHNHMFVALAIFSLAILSSVPAISAEETRRTSEDRFAERDIRDAAQDLDLMHRILGAELQRLVSRSGGSESADVAFYLHEESGRPMDLGDVRISLTTRYIERERRQMVAAIGLLKADVAEDCGNTDLVANQLLDAAARAKVLAALRCHQRQLDRMQSGMHKVIQGYEATLPVLKLPRYTQEKMLAEAHAYSLEQDAALAKEFVRPRQIWQANVDLLTYLDEHAAHAHYVNKQLVFDDPAEAKGMQELSSRLQVLSQ